MDGSWLKRVDYLEGPVTADLFVGTGKRVWLFGDYHTMTFRCARQDRKGRTARLEQVVAEWAAGRFSEKKRLDVFLEQGRTATAIPPGGDDMRFRFSVQTYIDSLSLFLQGCNSAFRGACYYPNVRVHNVDLRKEVPAYQKIMMQTIVRRPDRAALAAALNTFVTGGARTVRDVFGLVLELSGGLAQIERLKDDTLRTGILEIVRQWMDMPFFATELAEARRLSGPALDRFLRHWRSYSTMVVDAPLLARLLDPGVEQALVFVGYVHARRLVRMILRLGVLRHEHPHGSYNGKPMQCMDVRHLPQPFFR